MSCTASFHFLKQTTFSGCGNIQSMQMSACARCTLGGRPGGGERVRWNCLRLPLDARRGTNNPRWPLIRADERVARLVGWLVVGVFTSWQHLRSYQDRCRLVTVCVYGGIRTAVQFCLRTLREQRHRLKNCDIGGTTTTY